MCSFKDSGPGSDFVLEEILQIFIYLFIYLFLPECHLRAHWYFVLLYIV